MPEYISKYFTREEVSCRCGCGFDAVSQNTLNAADAYRKHYNKPIIPSSVCRCPAHNKKVGGSPSSRHLPWPHERLRSGVLVFRSRAMDLPVKNPEAAANWFHDNFPTISTIIYDTFIHIDDRERRITLDYR